MVMSMSTIRCLCCASGATGHRLMFLKLSSGHGAIFDGVITTLPYSIAKRHTLVSTRTHACVKLLYEPTYPCPRKITTQAHTLVPVANRHTGTRLRIVLQYCPCIDPSRRQVFQCWVANSSEASIFKFKFLYIISTSQLNTLFGMLM